MCGPVAFGFKFNAGYLFLQRIQFGQLPAREHVSGCWDFSPLQPADNRFA